MIKIINRIPAIYHTATKQTLTAILLYFVFIETGWATALGFFLIALGNEVRRYD